MKVKNTETKYKKYDILLKLIVAEGKCKSHNRCTLCPFYELGCVLLNGEICNSVEEIHAMRLKNSYKEFYSELSNILRG